MADFKYDVFISYSSANKDWVRKDLLSALEKAGLKVCIDFRDFKVGKPALKNMRDGILESRHTLLVLTDAYLKSGWTEFESLISQTLDPANRKIRVVPMLKEKCDLPLEISYLTYVNFYNPDDWDIAWKQLLEALGSLVTLPPVPVDIRWFFGHRYGDIENFTGRAKELGMLTDWLNNDKDNLLILRALGGFGKSILAWQWFNDKVDKQKWQTAVWWSFYEKESGFESFLSETLKHLGVEVKESARLQVNDLLEAMRGTNILIVLDGFERLLCQYGRMDAALQSDDEDADIDPSQRDCSSPLTETFLRGLSGAGTKSKVLMTTRLCPRALESADGKLLKGCRDETLSAFSPEDAVTYFHNEGIAATRAEIIEVCAAYGYHPLSLSLLVGLINEDHAQRGDIAAVTALEIFEDVKARRHHVLERAYESLAPERRDLLSKISCFRGSMEYDTIKKVFASKPSGNFLTKLFKSQADENFDLDKALLDLRKRGLLQYAGETQRYDMHPIVRHYAYDHFTDKKRRKEAHMGLAKYFSESMPAANTKVETLEDLAPVIELYHHLVKAGRFDEAKIKLQQRLVPNPLHYQFGAYQLMIELKRALFPDGEDRLPRLKDKESQAWTFNALATSYSMNGQPHRAVQLYKGYISISEDRKDKQESAVGLANMGGVQVYIGALKEAESNLRRAINLWREIKSENWESMGRQELAFVLSYRGAWQEAEHELAVALQYSKKTNDYDGLCISKCYQSLIFLFRKDPIPAVSYAQNALDAWEKDAERTYPKQRNRIITLWLLGAAYCAYRNFPKAEENLSKALNLCRQINLVAEEANILLDLARLRYAQGDFKDAQEKASEALVITERSGYVLQGADVNLFLATLEESREQRVENSGGKERAKKYAEEALRLATCDGGEYTYKVAYDEAVEMLKRMKDER